MMNVACSNDVQLDEPERARLRALAEAEGVERFSQRVGSSATAVVRGIAGLKIRRGTAALLRQVLAAPASELGGTAP
jgi:hypothetical protein